VLPPAATPSTAIATLFTLTVVEPMMVGIFGAGMAHLASPTAATT
jgi:hypothetical protein